MAFLLKVKNFIFYAVLLKSCGKVSPVLAASALNKQKSSVTSDITMKDPSLAL